MTQLYKTTLAGLFACLLIASAFQAQAQVPAPGSVEELQALNAAAVSSALGTQFISPEQLALGSRFTKAMNLRTGLDQVFEAVFATTKTQILQSVADKPAETRARFIAAIDDALDETKNDMLDKLLNGLARYYATRLTADQLKETLALYETPLGQKYVRTPQSLTEAEKQEGGMYMMAHPAVLETMAAGIGSMEVTQALFARERPNLTNRFTARLCAALKARKLVSAACKAA